MNFTFKPDTSTISKYKPMQVYHHQRTIPSYFKTTDVQKDMLNDEYNIKICSALAGNFEGCIDWMFRKSYIMSDYAKNRKIPVLSAPQKDRKLAMSHLPGRATMVFVSDLNAEELTKNCKRANAANSFPELYFVPVFSKNGDKHDTAAAIISYWIARYPDKHIVIFAKQIGSRSFSISQIDNVCIMISDPSFASAIQKMCRNQTPDMTDPDKKAHIYWYTLNNLTVNLCPLFEVVKQMSIYTSNNQFDRSFLDTVDIFIEVDGEEMNMKDMPVSPYNDYLKSTANTFYRLSENFEYTTTNEQREKLYALFETLKADLTGVNGTSMSSKQAERDAQRMFDADKPETVFEGHTAAKVEKEQHEKKTEAEILERIVHIKNTIIAVAMRYGTHKSQSFNNFATDFSQITDNPLNPENVQILKQIYDKLAEYKILG